MKSRHGIFFFFFMVVSLSAAAAGMDAQTGASGNPPPAGKVRGPWADVRVGTRVEIKAVEPNFLDDIVTLKTMEVVAADNQSVTVLAGGSVNGRKKNDQKATLPRFGTPDELKKLTDSWGGKTGQKKLWIKGKEVLCDVYERREKHPTMDVVGTRTTYVSERVPTWIVRVINHTEGEGGTTDSIPHEILDFTWGPEEKPVPLKTEAKAAETGPAPKPAAADLPAVSATAANRALAAELMSRVIKTYYSIVETEATAFDASFLVKKNGAAVGTARSAWNSEAGETTTKFSGSLDEDEAGWLQTLANLGLLQAAFTEGDHDRLFAVRTDDGYVFSDDQAVSDAVKSRQTLLSADLTQSGEVLRLANGVVRRIVRKAEKNGERLFVTSARIVIRTPEGAGRTADYAFTFVTKGGLPFVGTMNVSDLSVDGKTTVWAFQLDKISFTRPAKRPEAGD